MAKPERTPMVAIVDDDASVLKSMDRLIRSFGYRTQVFDSGQEFLASGAAERAACVLLDVRMPGTNGLEVQSSLIESGAHVRILFVTAQASDEEERRARSAGAVEFLRKPVAEASLREAIENVVRASARGRRNGNGNGGS
jgi:FixJ family two-component response regulator